MNINELIQKLQSLPEKQRETNFKFYLRYSEDNSSQFLILEDIDSYTQDIPETTTYINLIRD